MDIDASAFPPRLDPTTRVMDGDALQRHATLGPHNSHPGLTVNDDKQDSDITLRPQVEEPYATESRVMTAAVSQMGLASHVQNDLHQQAVHARPVARLIIPPSSSDNSQNTSSTNDQEQVFTPSQSEDGQSAGNGNEQGSSQESQLLQLSQLAARRAKALEGHFLDKAESGTSRKRTADGLVKMTPSSPDASPVQRGAGHSRNTSAVSMASTSSRIGELSAELRARLSYAMVKVHHGWQSHSIDQVETFASQAASPTSSTSTIHFRHGSSASPQLSEASGRGSANSAPGTNGQSLQTHLSRPQMLPPPSSASPSVSAAPVLSLAPPVIIQPSRAAPSTARRNSNPKYTPTFLSHSQHASPTTGPTTPAQTTGSVRASHATGLGTPGPDPILFSPHQNLREQDAIETLLFMSSPGNSNNLKHAFPPSPSQPLLPHELERSGGMGQRRALPSSQPRRTLPSGRPSSQPQSQQRRVEFEQSPTYPTAMDVDSHVHSPHSRGTPKRKVNGAAQHGHGTTIIEAHIGPRLKTMPMSSGLSGPTRTRPALQDADLERMLDRANDGSSDSEGEIQIPAARSRGDNREVVGV